jgi:hypothetical protein
MYIYINMCTSLVVDTELVSREVCVLRCCLRKRGAWAVGIHRAFMDICARHSWAFMGIHGHSCPFVLQGVFASCVFHTVFCGQRLSRVFLREPEMSSELSSIIILIVHLGVDQWHR